eukprot:TRINITY_DN57471_c0_g1_i3.p1 TRINITY_DN57471_c0_g1~~TRINITY_DN57471_c0_g1_i3.p1  ORF type:complete len:298 (+),score=30.47 TRINITY_DN57471_c0_g1_i3:170-1063(+)
MVCGNACPPVRGTRHARRRRTFFATLAAAAAAFALCGGSTLPDVVRFVLDAGAAAFVDVDGPGVAVGARELEQLAASERSSNSGGGLGALRATLDAVNQGWHLCSVEGATCHCTGSAALHTWTGEWAMLRHVNGSIRCSPDSFGGDPRPHLAKLCSCRAGPRWTSEVVSGLNATISQRLVPRIEIGPASAGCAAEDDGSWTACSVMSTRPDASVVPERVLPQLDPAEQRDIALRRLDLCQGLVGRDQALRVLGVQPGGPVATVIPVKAKQAPLCAVVYTPEASLTHFRCFVLRCGCI